MKIKKTEMLFFLIIFFSVFGLAKNSHAATYYIDSVSGSDTNNGTSTGAPWKYAPGMAGCANNCAAYSHIAGDTFVLKGGVTWTIASDMLIIPASGITIEGGQQLSAPWGTGYPILTVPPAQKGAYGIVINGKSNIVIDGIKIYNNELSPSGGSGIVISGVVTNIEIKNSVMDHTGDQSIVGGPDNGSSHILIHDNQFSNTGRMFFAISDGTNVDDIQIYNNLFLGPGSWPGGYNGVHGDGIMIGSDCTIANTCLTNLKIHHNTFKGDWAQGATALIFMNNGIGSTQDAPNQFGGNHVQIYDNQLTIDTDGSISPALVFIASKWNDVKVYNNTFGAYYSGSNVISTCLSVDSAATNVDIKNNIFSGCTNTAIGAASASIISIDYNVYSPEIVRFINGWVGNQDCRTIADCYNNFGQEQHGKSGNPLFVTPPTGSNSGNWHLQSDSPARIGGVNLGSPYTTDLDGTVGTGRIGAYEYSSGTTDTTPPAAPSGLSVN